MKNNKQTIESLLVKIKGEENNLNLLRNKLVKQRNAIDIKINKIDLDLKQKHFTSMRYLKISREHK